MSLALLGLQELRHCPRKTPSRQEVCANSRYSDNKIAWCVAAKPSSPKLISYGTLGIWTPLSESCSHHLCNKDDNLLYPRDCCGDEGTIHAECTYSMSTMLIVPCVL